MCVRASKEISSPNSNITRHCERQKTKWVEKEQTEGLKLCCQYAGH